MYLLKTSKAAVFLLLGSLLLSACAHNQQAKVAEKPKSINITYVKAPLNIPSIIEKRTGAFEKEFGNDGIEIGYSDITSGPKQIEAMAAGSVDFAHCLGGPTAIVAAANGVDLKIIGMYSRAPKAFVLLAKDQSIQNPTDLKGKKVAGPKGTVLHQLLLAALAKNNMKAEDVEFISMDIPNAVAGLMNGSIDVALAAGPDVLRAQAAGARVIANGEGLVDATIVTAVRGEFLKKYPDLVKRFVKVHQETLAYYTANKEAAFKQTAEETGLSLEAVQQMAPWYDFDMSIKPSDIQELKNMQEFLKQNGMLTKTVDIEKIIAKIE